MEPNNKELIDRVIATKSEIRLMEPCDCGAMVRHNNGGNYHALVAVKFEGGIWRSRQYTTCELVEKPEWKTSTEQTDTSAFG